MTELRAGAGYNVPLPHWAFLPPPPLGTLGAVRVRSYRPLSAAGGLTQRTRITQADGKTALARDVYQQDSRCIEEHWWLRDAVPSSLIPPGPQPDTVTRLIRIDQRDRAAAATVAMPGQGHHHVRELSVLLAALKAALTDDVRHVISLAARFSSLPLAAAARTVRIGSGVEGQLSLDVAADDGRQVLQAVVWFGCGGQPCR